MTRDYEARDITGVEAVLRALGWEDRFVHGQLRAVRALASDAAGRVSVAADGAAVRGFVSLELHDWNQLAQLHGLAVDPAHRRRGLGTQLLKVAESAARSAGSRGVYLDTPVDNAAARAFYEARGYTAAYVMPRYYADESDGVTYARFFTVAEPPSRS